MPTDTVKASNLIGDIPELFIDDFIPGVFKLHPLRNNRRKRLRTKHSPSKQMGNFSGGA